MQTQKSPGPKLQLISAVGCLPKEGFHTSQNHRMLGLEGTSVGHLVQHPRRSRVTYSRLQRTLSRWVLNISREGDSTTSLGSLCQCSVTLRVKKFFLMFFLILSAAGLGCGWSRGLHDFSTPHIAGECAAALRGCTRAASPRNISISNLATAPLCGDCSVQPQKP